MFNYHQKSKTLNLSIAGLALAIWILYSFIAPGGEFFQAYRFLVLAPDNLIETFGYPMTFNPPWLAPIMAPFVTMPNRAGFIFFLAITIILFYLSSSELNGKFFSIFLSSQLFWILWWGQIEALPVFGIALGWSAIRKKSWEWMLLAILLVSLKPQIGFFPMIYLWWISGKDRWKSLIGFVIIVLISISIYGLWPVWIVDSSLKMSNGTQYGPWNSSIGLWALPLLIPAFLLKLDNYQRLIALTATGLLISPYMPYYSTVIMFCFALPWWSSIFAFLGYFPSIFGTRIAWNGIVLLPILVLVWLYWPHINRILLFTKKRNYSGIHSRGF